MKLSLVDVFYTYGERNVCNHWVLLDGQERMNAYNPLSEAVMVKIFVVTKLMICNLRHENVHSGYDKYIID